MARKKKKTSLTNKEIARIEKHGLVMETESLKLTLLKAKLEIVKLKAQSDMREFEQSIKLQHKSIGEKTDAHSIYMKSLASLCDIKGKWSFDPETGEINKE